MRMLMTLLLLSCLGCSQYELLKTTEGGPLAQGAELTVLPVSYEGLRVGKLSEEEYLDTKEPEFDWAERKVVWATRLLDAVQEHSSRHELTPGDTPGAPLALHVHVTHIEPGFNAFVAARPSETRAVASVRDAGTDELLYQASVVSAHSHMGDRVGDDHADLGRRIAAFLDDQGKP